MLNVSQSEEKKFILHVKIPGGEACREYITKKLKELGAWARVIVGEANVQTGAEIQLVYVEGQPGVDHLKNARKAKAWLKDNGYPVVHEKLRSLEV